MFEEKNIPSRVLEQTKTIQDLFDQPQTHFQLKMLEDTTKYQIPFKEIKVFLTSFPICSYNSKTGTMMIF